MFEQRTLIYSYIQRYLALFVGLGQRLRRTPLHAWPTLEFAVREATALYVVTFLISASLGVIRQILLNARFGLGPEAAAYYAAFRLPETVAMLVAGGALTNALIPVLLRVANRDNEQSALRLVNATLTMMLAFIAPLALVAALVAPLFVRTLLAPGFDAPTQALTVSLSRLMLMEVLLVVAEAALAAILISRNQVLLPALAIAARNVTLIGGVLLAILIPEVGIYGPTIGALIDALIQLGLLVPGLRQRGYRPAVVWEPNNIDVHTVGRLMVPNALGAVSNYAGNIVDTAIASLTGIAAAIGALFNAWLLIGLPTRLLGVAVGQAALPHLALLGIRNDLAGFRRLILRTLVTASLLALLAAALLIALGRPLLMLLFQRGAFDAAAVALTYQVLVIYALGLPSYVATEVATRALVARYDTLTAMLANMLQLVIRIMLAMLLLERFGVAAVPMAHVLSAFGETVILLVVLWYKVRDPLRTP
ncbi:lipid II flippase MurJ [Candidatus Chloroploca sp. Khr17]|uniref:lipid II flippase MurJ n=1 Tax=Candidatus Chloroploca sp. Khr17 TaxID=2496869 RepID=UPI0013EA8B20|nr:lipid II flippase MurJ [Candidatus Chloroploca sp. Khr17]